MKRTTIFFLITIGLSAISVLCWQHLKDIHIDDKIACIYQDNMLIKSVDLSNVTEDYDFEVTSGNHTNIIRIEKDRICVKSANCPDQVCTKQGYISDGIVPIVCLPNKLVIKIESKSELDTMVN